MHLPVSSTVKLCETAQRMATWGQIEHLIHAILVHLLPAAKKSREQRRSCCRPNKADIDAITGWKIAEVRRYEVPAQKASAEVPLSFWAISSDTLVIHEYSNASTQQLTGSTVTRTVASSATIKDIKLRLTMMSSSCFVGVHSSVE